MTYESVKQILANARGENPASPEAVVLAGAACGLVSWACVCIQDFASNKLFELTTIRSSQSIQQRHATNAIVS